MTKQMTVPEQQPQSGCVVVLSKQLPCAFCGSPARVGLRPLKPKPDEFSQRVFTPICLDCTTEMMVAYQKGTTR